MKKGTTPKKKLRLPSLLTTRISVYDYITNSAKKQQKIHNLSKILSARKNKKPQINSNLSGGSAAGQCVRQPALIVTHHDCARFVTDY